MGLFVYPSVRVTLEMGSGSALSTSPCTRCRTGGQAVECGCNLIVNPLQVALSLGLALLINQKVPSWERTGMVVLADKEGVVALFGATRTFARDGAQEDLWVRLSVSPPR